MNSELRIAELERQVARLNARLAMVPDVVTQRDGQSAARAIDWVCAYFLISREHLMARCRAEKFVWPRHLCALVLRDGLGMILVEIARAMRRDHTNVSYAVGRARALCEAYPRCRLDYETALEALGMQGKKGRIA